MGEATHMPKTIPLAAPLPSPHSPGEQLFDTQHCRTTVLQARRRLRASTPMVDVADFTVSQDGGSGSLETRLFWPRSLAVPRSSPPSHVAAAAGGACALVVHQYSVMGGSQELMRGMARCFPLHHGVTAVTLSLRGAGGSSGCASLTGHAEVDDVVVVGQWLQAAGFTRILLVCCSAGGPIGGSALDRLPAFTGFVALGYVFGWWASLLFGRHYQAVLDSAKPKLFVQGDRDEFTSVAQLRDWVVPRSRSQVTETQVLPGVSHFALEGSLWDAAAAQMAVDFATRVGAWGNVPAAQASGSAPEDGAAAFTASASAKHGCGAQCSHCPKPTHD